MIKAKQSYQESVFQMISWGHWFTLFNILLILPIGSLYLFESDWPRTLLGRIYALISWLGHFSFVAFILYLLIIFPLTFVIRSERWMKMISALLATIGITLLLIDVQVFLQFHIHLNPTIWQLISNPHDSNLSRDWQFLFIGVPIIFLLEILLASWSWSKIRSLVKRDYYVKPFVVLVVVCFFSSHILHIWADANFYRPITMQRSNLPLSYPMTARTFLEKHGLFDRQAYDDKSQQEGNPTASAIEYPLRKINFADKGTGYNILLVTVDYIDYRSFAQDMPNLYQYSLEQQNFIQHISSGNTVYSGLIGLFYGISPSYLDGILNEKYHPVLFDALKQQGYNLQFMSADGFQSLLYHQVIFAEQSIVGKTTSNTQLTRRWISELSKLPTTTPWFSYLNYSIDLTSETNLDAQFRQRYQQKITEIDKQIPLLIDSLKEKELLEKTVIIITASRGGDSRQYSVRDYSRTQLQVPLIIYWPGKPAQIHNKLTGHNDISVTLMQDILHVANNIADYSQGENLFAEARRNDWVLSGEPKSLVITTPTQTIILREGGNYTVYDTQYQPINDQHSNLSLLVQVLTEMKRFIAD